MNNSQINLLVIGILLIFIAVIGFGCHSFFSNRTPPKFRKIADRTRLGPEWLELTPENPLIATGKIQFIGLKIKDFKERSGGSGEKLLLNDGTEILIEVELIGGDGRATALFPNGVGEFVEFGKRTQNRENIETAYFQIGEKFNKIRLRSSKELAAEEISWMEFEF